MGLYAALRSATTVEGGLSNLERGVQLTEGIGQLVADFVLLNSQCGAGFRQPQFDVADLRVRGSKADRHAEFEAQAPAGLLAAQQVLVVAARDWCRWVFAIAEQLVAETVDLIPRDEIKPRLRQTLGRLQLELQ